MAARAALKMEEGMQCPLGRMVEDTEADMVEDKAVDTEAGMVEDTEVDTEVDKAADTMAGKVEDTEVSKVVDRGNKAEGDKEVVVYKGGKA